MASCKEAFTAVHYRQVGKDVQGYLFVASDFALATSLGYIARTS